MTEILKNQYFFYPLWLGITFFCLASATVVMSLFIYNRKHLVLFKSILLYLFFFIAFSQFLVINENISIALKTANDPDDLSLTRIIIYLISGLIIIIFDIIFLIETSKGFKQARFDIEASVKALIPKNSVWKLENGLTNNFIKKYRISEAELNAANLALLGKSNKEIAGLLHKAVGTIETQLKSVYQKTEVTGRFALIALVAQSVTSEDEEKN